MDATLYEMRLFFIFPLISEINLVGVCLGRFREDLGFALWVDRLVFVKAKVDSNPEFFCCSDFFEECVCLESEPMMPESVRLSLVAVKAKKRDGDRLCRSSQRRCCRNP